MKKVALMVDGGYLRALVNKSGENKSGKIFNPEYIEKIVHASVASDEELYRALYYDCAPYVGVTPLPVSGDDYAFTGSDQWLHDLASRDMFAVRLGVLKFRGWKPKKIPVQGGQLKDNNFRPDFEQKGVDMRIGLDIAILANTRAVERVVLITADTDFIPAMKYGRRSGIQIVAIKLPNGHMSREFLEHVDINRSIEWP